MVRQELEETHAKIAALQELVGTANRDLISLDGIVDALDDSHTVSQLIPTDDGYDLHFKDGKVIHIHYGVDGIDGRVLPLGVRLDEDGFYYWTVDGEWLTDADGNKVRAGAVDGKDGIVPQIKVEDGFWWISADGGENYTQLASCEDMDGCGVFRDGVEAVPDSGFVRLTLWDGESLELPLLSPVTLSFDGAQRDTVLIAGGEVLSIPYRLNVTGETDQPLIVTSGTDGTYHSEIVEGTQPGTGVVKVHAPDVFAEGYILLSAFCDGYSALKMISFREREILPADDVITVRLASLAGTRTISYDTNFDYNVSPTDSSWLTVLPEPEAKTLSFEVTKNIGKSVRYYEVTVTPKDNPDFVCTTFKVYQATTSFTVDTEEISAPAEGGSFDVWLTAASTATLTAGVPAAADWIQAGLTEEDGFWHMTVQVSPNGTETGRESAVTVKSGSIPLKEIKIVQAGPAAGE